MTPETAQKKETSTMIPSASQVRRRRGVLAVLATVAALTVSGCAGAGDLVSYELPADSARYTFETETDGVATVWQYVSDKPSKGEAPKQNPCMGDLVGGNDAACRPESLIFLRYDLGLALDNTAKAGKRHEITVTAYYQERLTAPPKVNSLKIEASYDGGKSWKPVTSRASGGNTYTAQIDNPSGKQAAQSVGLRVHATDTKGDTVRQTMPTAYKLS
ncbi:hypothetical protein V2W30_34765 [Streptomyces sp. Q6]|uniref:Uncharacterized protein n=1 Tax=Streptomyces citrinus TaxID=3118173 RepID=A0ACD5AL86_9ACTN